MKLTLYQIIYVILLMVAIFIMINDYFVNMESIGKCSKAWRIWQETNSTCEMASVFCHKVPVEPINPFKGP